MQDQDAIYYHVKENSSLDGLSGEFEATLRQVAEYSNLAPSDFIETVAKRQKADSVTESLRVALGDFKYLSPIRKLRESPVTTYEIDFLQPGASLDKSTYHRKVLAFLVYSCLGWSNDGIRVKAVGGYEGGAVDKLQDVAIKIAKRDVEGIRSAFQFALCFSVNGSEWSQNAFLKACNQLAAKIQRNFQKPVVENYIEMVRTMRAREASAQQASDRVDRVLETFKAGDVWGASALSAIACLDDVFLFGVVELQRGANSGEVEGDPFAVFKNFAANYPYRAFSYLASDDRMSTAMRGIRAKPLITTETNDHGRLVCTVEVPLKVFKKTVKKYRLGRDKKGRIPKRSGNPNQQSTEVTSGSSRGGLVDLAETVDKFFLIQNSMSREDKFDRFMLDRLALREDDPRRTVVVSHSEWCLSTEANRCVTLPVRGWNEEVFSKFGCKHEEVANDIDSMLELSFKAALDSNDLDQTSYLTIQYEQDHKTLDHEFPDVPRADAKVALHSDFIRYFDVDSTPNWSDQFEAAMHGIVDVSKVDEDNSKSVKAIEREFVDLLDDARAFLWHMTRAFRMRENSMKRKNVIRQLARSVQFAPSYKVGLELWEPIESLHEKASNAMKTVRTLQSFSTRFERDDDVSPTEAIEELKSCLDCFSKYRPVLEWFVQISLKKLSRTVQHPDIVIPVAARVGELVEKLDELRIKRLLEGLSTSTDEGYDEYRSLAESLLCSGVMLQASPIQGSLTLNTLRKLDLESVDEIATALDGGGGDDSGDGVEEGMDTRLLELVDVAIEIDKERERARERALEQELERALEEAPATT